MPARPRAALLAWLATEVEGLAERIEDGLGGPEPSAGLVALRRALLADASPQAFARGYAEALVHGALAARLAWSRPVAASLASIPELAPLLDLDPRIGPRFGRLMAELDQLEPPEGDDAATLYEAYLAAHDRGTRQRCGVYFTPPALVARVLERVDAQLEQVLGLDGGLASSETWAELAARKGVELPAGVDASEAVVRVLDPAAGAGNFLVAVVERVHARFAAEHAEIDPGVRAQAWTEHVRDRLIPGLHGIELRVGPWAIALVRVRAALESTGHVFGEGERLALVRGDALALEPSSFAGVSVVVGNPPFGREAAGSPRDRSGLLSDYLARARSSGAGAHVKNLYNLYVYFWRWATRLVFAQGPGVVSLITPSSYLRGPGFVGMRAAMRAEADRIEILDLGGETRGGVKGANVFDIATPVCIGTLVVGLERGQASASAEQVYALLEGSRAAKLEGARESARGRSWQRGSPEPEATFVVTERSAYDRWPALTELFPWQHSGAQFKRTWPIAATPELLERRWAELLAAAPEARRASFRETRDRRIARGYRGPLVDQEGPAIAELAADAPLPRLARYAYRPFDRHWCLADARLGDFLRPVLWRAWSPEQVYMSSLLGGSIGAGPAALVAGEVPDLHHFRGSYGGRDVIPLWTDASAQTPNLDPGWRARMAELLATEIADDALFAYAFAILANPGYVERFAAQLRVPGPRVPLTRSPALFERGVALGRTLIEHHCLRRPVPTSGVAWRRELGRRPEDVPHSFRFVDGVLQVGDGLVGPISPAIRGFSVSGYRVLEGWLGYRMYAGSGRRSSVLDELRPRVWDARLDAELIDVIDLLDWTLDRHIELDSWLDALLAGPLVEG